MRFQTKSQSPINSGDIQRSIWQAFKLRFVKCLNPLLIAGTFRAGLRWGIIIQSHYCLNPLLIAGTFRVSLPLFSKQRITDIWSQSPINSGDIQRIGLQEQRENLCTNGLNPLLIAGTFRETKI